MKLKDKVVVITGASRGFGKTLAEELSKEGCKIVLSARSEKELEEASKKIGARYFVADVTKEKDVSGLAEFSVKEFGRIDIWVNNAGIFFPHAPIGEIDWEKARVVLEVNLFGLIYGSKYALEQMKKQKEGVIINILSTSALEGKSGAAEYCASKYAAAGFTKVLRIEGGAKVIAVYPGGMKTLLFSDWKHPEYDKFMDPKYVAEKVISNLKKEEPEEELIIRRPK